MSARSGSTEHRSATVAVAEVAHVDARNASAMRTMRSMRTRPLGGRQDPAQGHLAAGADASPRPYRRDLLIFLVVIVVDALIGVATPVLAGRVINTITAHGAVHVVVRIAFVIAALAVFDAGAVLRPALVLRADRRRPDLRPADRGVRARAADAAGLLHPDPDRRADQPAEQRRPRRAAGVHHAPCPGSCRTASASSSPPRVMFSLSWQITALSLVMLPVFVIPARRIGNRLQAITRESYNLNASMNTTMTERFNVSGALLVKLFGRPREEFESFRQRAGRVRDIGDHVGHVRAGLLRRADPGRCAGPGAGLRPRRLLRAEGRADDRHRRDPGAAAHPPVRAADRAVERARRRDERAGQLRPGLRDARPRPDDRGRARRGRAGRRRPHASSSATSGSPIPLRPRSRSPRWRTSRRWTTTRPRRCCAASASPPNRVRWWRWSGPSGAGKTTISQLRAADLRRARGCGAGRR